MTPDKRREAIIDATLRVMTRKGMAATTVRDVAEEMGTSSGLIHHYVTSMDELLASAFEQAAGQDLAATRESMASAGGPVERLARFFDGYARADQDWAFQLWLDAWSEAGRRPAVRATSYRLNVAWQELIAETIRQGVAAGLMTCAAPDDVAWRVLSLLDGLTLQAVAHRTAIDRDAVIEWGAAYAETEVGLPSGALTPPPAQIS
ncbi:MAG: TetR/AcrR family transcriptional regulator [Actinomycetales bacterium]